MLPVVLSIVGGMLPMIVDAFRSGRSPEEAAKIVAPKRQEIVDRLVGSGMNQSAAEAMADESIKGELEKAQLPEPMNPWISTALMAAGAFGGYKLGGALAGKFKGVQPSPAGAPSAEEVAMTGKTSQLPMSTDISNMGKATDIRGMGQVSQIPLSTDISNMGKVSTLPPARGGMRAMSDPVTDIVPPRPTDTPFPPRDRFGGITSELSPLPGPAQVPEWVRGAPNPSADIVNKMVSSGPFPNRFVPPIDKRAEMQMAREELEAMLAQEQAMPRTPGTRLVAPWS